MPAWVASPQNTQTLDCIREFVCTVGEGSDLSSAQAQARSELAKIFGVEISADFFASESLSHRGHSERFEDQLREVTRQVLSGVVIRKNEIFNHRYYSLATLDLIETRRQYNEVLNQFDNQLVHHFAIGRRSDLVKARELWHEREKAHRPMQALSFFRPAPINLTDIEKKLNDLPTTGFWLHFSEKKDEGLEGFIKDQLHQMRHAHIPKSDGARIQGVEVKLDWEALNLNVEGFSAYQFSLDLTSYTNNQKKTTKGHIHEKWQETARSFDQARERARKKMREWVASRLHELNLD